MFAAVLPKTDAAVHSLESDLVEGKLHLYLYCASTIVCGSFWEGASWPPVPDVVHLLWYI